MAMTPDDLKQQKQDYFIASWHDQQLEMEPHCHCGRELEENYHCELCDRDCDCTFILCSDDATYHVVQKFVHGNPDFKHFQFSLKA